MALILSCHVARSFQEGCGIWLLFEEMSTSLPDPLPHICPYRYPGQIVPAVFHWGLLLPPHQKLLCQLPPFSVQHAVLWVDVGLQSLALQPSLSHGPRAGGRGCKGRWLQLPACKTLEEQPRWQGLVLTSQIQTCRERERERSYPCHPHLAPVR